jgi:ribonuclease T2
MRGWLYSFAVCVFIFTVSFGSPAGARGEPGDFDYYVLALSWSPSYCETASGRSSDTQCNSGKGYAFVLHGLWPQYWRGWPQDCQTKDRPWVPRPLIDRMLDIMPSSGLVIHEYKKHGTCSGLAPEPYFELARTLFNSIRMPERFASPSQTLQLSPDEIKGEFLKSNPHLKPSMLQAVCESGTFKELRVCFSKDRQPLECGEDAGSRVCTAGPQRLPPVRGRR